MSVKDTTPPSQSDHISFEVDLSHPPQKVWRALTEPALLAEWLLPVVRGSIAPGAAFTLQTQPYPPWDGTVACRVVEIDPPRKLSYAWVVGGDMDLDTIVTFTLTPTATGTTMSVVQAGFQPHQKQNAGGARYGWKMMTGKLVDLLGRTA